jgi:hypothetical protein
MTSKGTEPERNTKTQEIKSYLTHEISVLGKTVPTLAIAAIVMLGGASAAVLSSFGTVSGEAQVDQAVTLESPDSKLEFDGDQTAGETVIETRTLDSNADVTTEIGFETTCSNSSDYSATVEGVEADWGDTSTVDGGTSGCTGIKTQYVEYFDSAGADFTSYSSTNSPDLEVGEDKEYGSIGAAVADASSDQTILVNGGDYDPFTVNKSGLKVVAANAPDSDASGSEGSANVRGAPNGIEVTEEASGATVKGFNIDVSEEKETDSRGILVKASEVTVDSNYVNGVRAEDRAIGIYVYGHHKDDDEGNDLHAYNVDGTTVINNKVEDVKASGLSAEDKSYPPRAEGVVITENEGTDNSADSVTLRGNTITDVGESNPGISAAIAVDGGNAQDFVIKSNEISDIEHKDAPNYPYDLGIYVTGYGGEDSVEPNTDVENNNFLMSTSDDVDVASDAQLDASGNWFGTNGIQTGPAVDASWKEKSDTSVEAETTDKFGVVNEFAINLKQAGYKLTSNIVPKGDSKSKSQSKA